MTTVAKTIDTTITPGQTHLMSKSKSKRDTTATPSPAETPATATAQPPSLDHLDPTATYLARDVILLAPASKDRVGVTLHRHDIGRLIGDRRQLTADDVRRACEILRNPKPVGPPRKQPLPEKSVAKVAEKVSTRGK